MINVLIFLDMVWFWFLIFTHDDHDDAFRSFLRCLCHIEVCVAVSEVVTSFAIKIGPSEVRLSLNYRSLVFLAVSRGV